MDTFIYSFIYEFNIYLISLNYRCRSIDCLQGSLHKDPGTATCCQTLFPVREGKDHEFKGKNWIRRCSYSYKFGIWPTAPKNRARNQTGSWNWRNRLDSSIRLLILLRRWCIARCRTRHKQVQTICRTNTPPPWRYLVVWPSPPSLLPPPAAHHTAGAQ